MAYLKGADEMQLVTEPCTFVRWFGSVSRHDVGLVGGKGANLGELTRLGMPVPPGFCITIEAYRQQTTAWRFLEKIAPPLADQRWDEVARVADEEFLRGVLDQTLVAQVLEAYRKLGSPAVAVRSSATEEDSQHASFAGQQETYLNVHGEESLLQALRRCWASLWSPRAMHYRNRHGMDVRGAAISVVVQRMVPADSAGVLFTVDPATNRADRMLVEATVGLGDSLVSGEVAGDLYRVDRTGRLALAQRSLRQERPALSDAQVIDLCRLGLQLETHFGCPQDVEFAVAEGELFLLQARPITTLPAVEPEAIPPMGKLTRVQRTSLQKSAERYPVPPKPLDNLAVSTILMGSVLAFQHFGLRVSEADQRQVLERTWWDALVLPQPRPTWRLLGFPARLARLLARDWNDWWRTGPQKRLEAVACPASLSDWSDAQLIAHIGQVRETWQEIMGERMLGTLSMYVVEAAVRVLTTLSVGRRARDAVFADLLSGLHTRTAEVNAALWDLSRAARKHPAVAAAIGRSAADRLAGIPEAAPFLALVRAFLADYGHREGSLWYLSTPTWRRQPDALWPLLKGLLPMEHLPGTDGTHRYADALRRATRGIRYVPGLSRWFERLVDRYRAMQVYEEESHFDLTRPLDALQGLSRECGRRLVGRRLLAREDDIFYLTMPEIAAWLTDAGAAPHDAAQVIARRKATFAQLNERWQSRRFTERTTAHQGRLHGEGASPGVVRGKARIIRGEHEFDRLEQGEILVCPYTNPSWTPLFAAAAAVVTETGGIASHAAIVAREYGIPAVMGVADATAAMTDGQEVLVDGSRGIVLLGGDGGGA